MEITFINVGYGESILITAGDPEREEGQFVMLIDGGSLMDFEYTGESGRIRSYNFLKKSGITHIDLLVFSHVHEDHTSGLIPIIENIPVRQFWTSIRLSPEHVGKRIEPTDSLTETNRKALFSINDYSRLMKELENRDITILDGIKPDYFRAGDLAIDILGPDPDYKKTVEASLGRIFTAGSAEALDNAISETTESINNASLILRLKYQGRTVLLCGDTNAKGFRHVFQKDPSLLRAKVYKIGHHGQPDSVSKELVRAVDPSVIVCCASNDHRSNSSSETTFETIREAMKNKPVTYLFHDGLYMEKWNPDTSPRNGIRLHIDENKIDWETIMP